MIEIVKLNKGEKSDYAEAELMQEKLIYQIKKELNSFKVPECGMVVVKAVRKSLM